MPAIPTIHPAASPATLRLAELGAELPSVPRRRPLTVLCEHAERDAAAARRVEQAVHTRTHHALGRVGAAPTVARGGALLAGSTLLGFAIALLLQAELGAGPWDVLIGGIAAQLGASHGAAAVAAGALAIGLGVAMGGRRAVGPGTLVTVAVVGPTVDAARAVVPAAANAFAGTAMLALALVAIVAAVSLIVSARLGGGAVEVLTQGLRARGVPMRWARTGLEATASAVGWLAGGPAGLATVIIAASIGHLLAWALPPAPPPGPSSEEANACDRTGCPVLGPRPVRARQPRGVPHLL
ncbi:hypothetical protein ER308_11145 [Egibacter rhizosphaerae]|uniref:Uncharacterized protein n=1 Tax=Egibacter rhizosphaerae TaxID=1670831 RepID=A0A411YG49_9ACTN|nr:hypothetical protein [Egibacter rhizosphaerae]QBI20062.1 hypothetical protein ER308_11145 [Egibacter rhizosphaerae]